MFVDLCKFCLKHYKIQQRNSTQWSEIKLIKDYLWRVIPLLKCPKCKRHFNEVFHEVQYELAQQRSANRYENEKIYCPTCTMSLLKLDLQNEIELNNESNDEKKQLLSKIESLVETLNSKEDPLEIIDEEIRRICQFENKTERQLAQLSILQDVRDRIISKHQSEEKEEMLVANEF